MRFSKLNERRKRPMFSQQLKNFSDAHRLDIHELVELAAAAEILRKSYEDHGVAMPDWLEGQAKSIDRVIRARRADALELKRAQVLRQIEGLKSPTQRKASLEK